MYFPMVKGVLVKDFYMIHRNPNDASILPLARLGTTQL